MPVLSTGRLRRQEVGHCPSAGKLPAKEPDIFQDVRKGSACRPSAIQCMFTLLRVMYSTVLPPLRGKKKISSIVGRLTQAVGKRSAGDSRTRPADLRHWHTTKRQHYIAHLVACMLQNK